MAAVRAAVVNPEFAGATRGPNAAAEYPLRGAGPVSYAA